MRRPFLAPLALLGLAALAAAPLRAQEPPYGTIIVANMGDDSVWLIDAATGARRASFDTHVAPHEVAVSSDGRIAAVTNYGDQRGPGNVVQFVDVATGALTHEITVEGFERLHGAVFLNADRELALTSERTGEILVVAVSDGALLRRLPTEARMTHMVAPGGRWLYVASIADGAVSRVDPAGVEPTLMWPVGAARTEGVAATPDGRQGWTASMETGTVFGVDGATGETVARVDGLEVPYRLAVTPDGRTVVVSDPDAGRLVLIDRLEGSVRTSIDVDGAARAAGLGEVASPQGFTLSPDGAWAFVAANEIGRVALVHLPSARVVRFVEAGRAPDGIGFSPVRG